MTPPKVALLLSFVSAGVAGIASGPRIGFYWTQGNSPRGMSLSRDGNLILDGRYSGLTEVRDGQTFAHKFTLVGHTAPIECTCLLPDGLTGVNAGNDQTMRVWDLQTGLLKQVVTGFSGDVWCCAATPDGSKVVTGDATGRIQIWSVPSFAKVFDTGNLGKGSIVSVVAAPDSSAFSVCFGDGTAKEFFIDGSSKCDLTGSPFSLSELAWHPDGSRLLAVGGSGKLQEYDASTGVLLRTFPAPVQGLRACYSSDGALVASSWLFNLYISDAVTGTVLRSVEMLREPDTIIASGPGHRFLVKGGRGMWLMDGDTGAILRSRLASSGASSFGAVSKTGKYFVAGKSVAMDIFDGESGEILGTIPYDSGSAVSAVFEPSGQYFCAGFTDGKTRIYNVSDWSLARTIYLTSSSCLATTARADGQLTCGYADKSLRVYDGSTGALLRTLTGHTGQVNSLAYYPQGNKIASASDDGTVIVWDADTGAGLGTVPLSSAVKVVAVSPDGSKLLTGSADGNVRVFGAESGTLLRTIPASSQVVRAIVFTAGNREVMMGGKDGFLRLWDVNSGALLATPTFVGATNGLALGCNGRMVGLGGDEAVGNMKIARSVTSGP
ncbi:MAG: PQQ-binding-like beta-propeller repeat protein [Armatimonadetes bacterium]|nr:PQQ-binding-like beta-propeller repeat protein [Armatimonadota bacterium]